MDNNLIYIFTAVLPIVGFVLGWLMGRHSRSHLR